MALRPLQYDIKVRDKSAAGFQSFERRAQRATAKVAALGKAAKRAAGFIGIGATLGLTVAFRKAGEAMEEFDLISKRARQFGLDSDFYQALAFQAGEMSIEQTKLNAALGVFLRRVGLAASAQGVMAQSLSKTDPILLKAILNAENQTERLNLVAEATRKAKTITDATAITYATMGDRSGELARLMRGGAAAFAASAEKARELGIIIDRDLLARSEQLQNDYGNVARVLDLELKQAFVDLAPVMIEAARIATIVARQIRTVFDNLQAVENRSRTSLLERRKKLNDLIEGPFAIKGGFTDNAFRLELVQIDATLRSIAKNRLIMELNRANDLADVPLKIDAITGATKKLTSATKKQKSAQDEVNQAADFFGNTAIDALIGVAFSGDKASDALRNMIPVLTRLILQASLLNQGPLAGLFGGGGIGGFIGSIFGGGRAHGGPVSAGKSYMVGERGPELFTPGASGRITPNGAGTSTIRIELNPSEAWIAGIADRQVMTRSGQIVQVAVVQSQKATRRALPGMVAEAQVRSL